MPAAKEPAALRNVRSLRRGLEAARRGTSTQRTRNVTRLWEEFEDALSENEIAADDFSLRIAFEELVPDGRELVRYMDSPQSWGNVCMRIGEADGIRMSDFSDFTYAVLSNKVMEEYNSPEFIGGMLTEKVSTKLRQERIGGISGYGDEAVEVGELSPIPMAKISPDYIDTPETKKYGLGAAVSREAVFFDRMDKVLSRAREVGQTLGLKKEKRILRTVMGIDNTWKPKDSHLSTDTYQPGGAGDAFDNIVAGNALVDWRNVREARRIFRSMIDPRTGEPIVLGVGRQMLIPDYLIEDAQRILNATTVMHKTDTANIETAGPNPVRGQAQIVTNEYVSSISGSTSIWFYGSFKKAFKYMENWPMQTINVPTNNFHMAQHDMVMAVFATEMGTPAIENPRYVCRNG